MNTSPTPESDSSHLERKFLMSPFLDTAQNAINTQEDVELDIGSVYTYDPHFFFFLGFSLTACFFFWHR